MKIYLIPGLGYDCRIFERISLTGYEVNCINWILPRRKETIQEYAIRLFRELPREEDIILIGHSFGGIMAQEIAAVRKIRKIILISSIQSREELPTFFKLVKPLRLFHFFTKELSMKTVKYWGGSHGFVSDAEINLFRSMVSKQSNTYLQWALKALSSWNPPELLPDTKVFQIHGTDDQTFPVDLLKHPDVLIEGATHIMVHKQPERISRIILEELG